MQIRWQDCKTFTDTPDMAYCTICLDQNPRQFEILIKDHSNEGVQIRDERAMNCVPYAYEIIIPDGINPKAFEPFGFKSLKTLNSIAYIGIDENPGYIDQTSKYAFKTKPQHTLDEVKDLLIKGFINSFTFKYQEELEKFKKTLDERQKSMDEVRLYAYESMGFKDDSSYKKYGCTFWDEYIKDITGNY